MVITAIPHALSIFSVLCLVIWLLSYIVFFLDLIFNMFGEIKVETMIPHCGVLDLK